MATFSDYTYAINGIVSTDKTVLQNLDTLTGACNTWMTYDTHEGLWAIVINQTGTSVASFDDTNILGAIAISGSGIDQLYNSVRVEFPHIDLRDEKDYILDTIPSVDWYSNEIANTLNMQFDIINDPVQAEYVGLVQLKQGRVDQIVRFASDFSRLGLKAGDLIDITSSTYGFVAKVFRILSIKESDAESGAIILDITAQAYDANVYSTDDLFRYTRTNSTGIATIGNVGVPGTPTVSKTEVDARPRITVSSTTPTGTVEAMEFWYSRDDYVYDENRVYTLLDTVKPTTGNVFPYGNTVTIVNDTIAASASNLFVKTRGINGQTTGPFSTPAGFVYTPVQVTDAISDTTQVSNTGTGSLLTALALTQLLKYVDNLFSANTVLSQGAGGVFDKMFKTFKGNTGYDITSNAGNLKTLTSNTKNVMISAASGQFTESGIAQSASNTATILLGSTITFTPPTSGTYKIDVLADQNTSGARGGRGQYGKYAIVNNLNNESPVGITNSGVVAGAAFDPSVAGQTTELYLFEPEDKISVGFVLEYNSNSSTVCNAGSGGVGAQSWQDFLMSNIATLSSTTTYDLKFFCVNWTRSNPTATASFDFGYNIYTIS